MPCTMSAQIDLRAYVVSPREAEFAAFRDHHPFCGDCTRALARLTRIEEMLRMPPDDLRGGNTPDRPALSSHPTPQQLGLYTDEPARLSPAEHRAIESHVDACAVCAAELRALAQFDFAQLAGARPSTDHVTTPGQGESILDRMRSWLGFDGGLLVPLAIVIVGAIGIGLWLAQPESEHVGPPSAPVDVVTNPTPDPLPAAPDATGSTDATGEKTIEGRTIEQAVAAEAATPKTTEPLEGDAPIALDRVAARDPATGQPVAELPADLVVSEEILLASLAEQPLPTYARPDVEFDSRLFMNVEPSRSVGGEVAAPTLYAPGLALGISRRRSPTLWWRLDQISTHPISVLVIADGADEPLVDLLIEAPVDAGLHATSLQELGLSLEPGRDHAWYVSVLVDPENPSRNPTASGAIRVAEPSGSALEAIEAAPPIGLGHALAAQGLWYDAVSFFAEAAAAAPADPRITRHLDALQQQSHTATNGPN